MRLYAVQRRNGVSHFFGEAMDYFKRTWAEIDVDALRHNADQVRKRFPVPLMFVVKADAYGHGAAMCAAATERHVDMFAVATPKEGMELRAAGIAKPILLLGAAFEWMDEAIRNDLTLTLYSAEYAEKAREAARRLGKKAACHVKIETGLNRLGFRVREESLEQDAAPVRALYDVPELAVNGIYSHFSASDSADPDDIAFTDAQVRTFTRLVSFLEAGGVNPGLRHLCASQAVLHRPDAHLDMIRSGILVLGVYYDEQTILDLDLRPAMSWKARVISLRDIRAGESVSYGRRFRAPRDMTIALVAAGYADGYKRCFGNRARVLAHGRSAPVVGNICMDYFLVDASGIPLSEGEAVTLMGADGGERIWINELGRFNSDIDVEVTLGMSRRVPRVYCSAGTPFAVRQYDDFSCFPRPAL